jgi:hypothetical protein
MFGKHAWVRLLFVVPLLAAGIALGAPSPAAAAFVCDQTISPRTIPNGTIKDSVVVPSGERCFMSLITVRGGVTVEPGGELYATTGEVRGSISATGAFAVTVAGMVVRGSVTAVNTIEWVDVTDSEIRGDVVVDGANVESLYRASTIRGSLRLNAVALAYVSKNVIEVDLVCTNMGSVTNLYDEPNSVGGVRSGDCAALE